MTRQKYVRQKYYVNPELQGRIIRRMATYWCFYHILLWHAMFLYRYLQYRDAVASGGRSFSVVDLYFGFAMQNTTLIVCASLVFPFFLWDVFMLSHRVAGPLVRFQNTLRRIAGGEQVSHIELRKGDLVFDLRDAFNDYLDSLALDSLAGNSDDLQAELASEHRSGSDVGRHIAEPACCGQASAGEHGESEACAAIVNDLRDIGSTVRKVKTDDSLAGAALDVLGNDAAKS
jgi:hypothetical protein